MKISTVPIKLAFLSAMALLPFDMAANAQVKDGVIDQNCPEIRKVNGATKFRTDIYIVILPVNPKTGTSTYRNINAELTFDSKIEKESPVATCVNMPSEDGYYNGRDYKGRTRCINNYTKETYWPDKGYHKEVRLIEQRRGNTVGGSIKIIPSPESDTSLNCYYVFEDKTGNGICTVDPSSVYQGFYRFEPVVLDPTQKKNGTGQYGMIALDDDGQWRGKAVKYDIRLINSYGNSDMLALIRVVDEGFYCAVTAPPKFNF